MIAPNATWSWLASSRDRYAPGRGSVTVWHAPRVGFTENCRFQFGGEHRDGDPLGKLARAAFAPAGDDDRVVSDPRLMVVNHVGTHVVQIGQERRVGCGVRDDLLESDERHPWASLLDVRMI